MSDSQDTKDNGQTREPDGGQGQISRRSLLGAAAAGSAGALFAAAAPASAGIRHGTGTPRRPLLPVHATQPRGPVVSLLGTSGGPPPDYVRTGISSVLTVEGHNYVVDAGRASVTQYLNAGLKFSKLEGIFIGALHADHIADYYNYFMLAGMENSEGDVLPDGPLTVYGPGPAGALPPPAVPGTDMPPIAPNDPTPGIVDMTNQLTDGYAYSNNIFIREQNSIPITTYTKGVTDIKLPSNLGANPLNNRAPNMSPFQIYEDSRVKVTATLVPLGLVFPAFAFRFDTEHGSVVFSQDNAPSQNLITLAKGADMLVHEVLDYEFYVLRGASKLLLKHFRAAHTFSYEVGFIAAKAGVDTLVLTHLSPSNPATYSDARYYRKARLGFKGNIIVGNDLDRIPVVRRRALPRRR